MEHTGAIHSTKIPQPTRPGKVVHLKRWTRFLETFPVGPNRSIEFWTEILVEWIAPYVYDPPALGWVVRFYHVNTVGSSLWNCLAPRRSLLIKFSPLIFLFPIVPCASLTVAFRAHLCAKNEAPEEEADSGTKLIPE